MPFGLKGAGACYSRFIDTALSQKNINCYWDDVLIYHQELNRHLDKLEEVLEVHQKAGIRINARKTNLLVSKCNYLGPGSYRRVSRRLFLIIMKYKNMIFFYIF